MRPEKYHGEDLVSLFRKERVVTMAEMKEALGTQADATVFRKLKTLDYLSSYSHSGRYYTLKGIPEFDEHGLWSHKSVHFSRYGTLLSTAEALVDKARAGWHAPELESLVGVPVKEALLELFRKGRVSRERFAGRFLYCSSDPAVRNEQLLTGRVGEIEETLGILAPDPRIDPEELKAAIVLFSSLLDEKQRRLYAGLESLKFGHGGDRKVAGLLGLDVGMIARGRQQLLERDIEIDRVRRAGGGRRRVEKKPPR